jgi:hypothetical protein
MSIQSEPEDEERKSRWLFLAVLGVTAVASVCVAMLFAITPVVDGSHLLLTAPG